MHDERRKYQRLHAPVVCRPLGRPIGLSLPVKDVSLGGIRVYTDDLHRIGDRLELELWLPDGTGLTLDSTVVWVDELGGLPAKFEVGLQFVDVAQKDFERLQVVLKSE